MSPIFYSMGFYRGIGGNSKKGTMDIPEDSRRKLEEEELKMKKEEEGASPDQEEKKKEEDDESNAMVEEEEEEEEEEAPFHLPFAPENELLNVSTTVDPSYVISLIRKILPCDKKTEAKKTPISTPSNVICSGLEDQQKGASTFDNSEQSSSSAPEDYWEECGCILWDLSVESIQATLMVENHLLEVLVAHLTLSNSFRVTEICLGIIGNIACHDVLSETIASTNNLVETVVGQLFQEDSSSLCEVCRLLSVSLKGSSFASWTEALKQEHILQHILWIAENTLNLPLLEKTIGLLLTIIESEKIGQVLMPSLITLGLPNLMIKMFVSEVEKVFNENDLERIPVLDLILEIIEALSTTENCSNIISSNEQLFDSLCDIVKFHDKIEIDLCYPVVVVIVANVITDKPEIASELLEDLNFLQGLFDMLPFVSTDTQARNALWSIMARIFPHINMYEIRSMLYLQKYVTIFIEKGHLIEEDLDEHPVQSGSRKNKESNISNIQNPDMITPSLKSICFILHSWLLGSIAAPKDTSKKAKRLLGYCQNYLK